jgi:hypothetical protein
VLHQEKKLHQSDGWDEGVILDFLKDPSTRCYTIDLTGGGKLTLFAQNTSDTQSLSQQTDALFRWLGVPHGFTLKLLWRNDPRTLAVGDWPSKRNVNGGFTYAGSNTIYVYRSEEWDRVLIHETIHALQWDWEMPANPLPCWEFKKSDTLSPALFEAWTELYAEWLWCGWHNISWKRQRDWQDYQATQILSRASAKESWNENTNVFAYYVLKAALAPHIAFLWIFGNGITESERNHVLCQLVMPTLSKLRSTHVRPSALSLRMTVEKK